MPRKPDITATLFRGCLIVFLAVFISLWYTIIFVAQDTYQEAEQAIHWPTVEGAILESDIQSETSSSQSRDSQGSTTRKTTTQYVPRIRYQYRVEGQEYENNILQKIANPGPQRAAQQIAQRYPQGSQTEVYYDPADPQNSVLIPGNSSETRWVLWLFTYVPIGILLVVLICWANKKFSSRRGHKDPIEKSNELLSR